MSAMVFMKDSVYPILETQFFAAWISAGSEEAPTCLKARKSMTKPDASSGSSVINWRSTEPSSETSIFEMSTSSKSASFCCVDCCC